MVDYNPLLPGKNPVRSPEATWCRHKYGNQQAGYRIFLLVNQA